MKKLPLKKWDSAAHLTDDESIALYFQACFEKASDDATFIAKALGNVARAIKLAESWRTET
ncbi:MAG: XRE family transcriptional regulator [Betaproteobacteria bacterium]|nr:XRE family transcriptional regulator [Betaproteobacteria bacterium]